jgi:hypothetical protein
VKGERGIYIYTVSGLVRDGRTNVGGEHQVLGRLEWAGRGGGIKVACLLAARLLCVFCLSRFLFSVCIKEKMSDDVNMTLLAQNSVQYWALVNMVITNISQKMQSIYLVTE